MTKPVTEGELIAHSTAPRVTEKELLENITNTSYFTAADAVVASNGQVHRSHQLLTICILVLKNGFTVTGESACASPENFDPEIGRRLAYDHAKRKVWELMGYALRDKLQTEADLLGSRAFPEARDQGVYIGTKVVHAFPLNRREYTALRGWQLPADENGDDEGYVVEYTDRMEEPRRVSGFFGYVSWSPKDVFENAYKKVGG